VSTSVDSGWEHGEWRSFFGETLRYMQKKRTESLSALSVQYHHAVLRKALGDAERLRLVIRNVAKLVTPPSPERREVEALPPEQARAVLKAMEEDRIAPLVALALTMGVRQGEGLGLTWSAVDFERSTITIRQTDPGGARWMAPQWCEDVAQPAHAGGACGLDAEPYGTPRTPERGETARGYGVAKRRARLGVHRRSTISAAQPRVSCWPAAKRSA